MTYWATLWYAGSVVLTLGSEGQKLNDCEMLGQVIMNDIESAYNDPVKLGEIQDIGVFSTNQFSFTCETDRLPVNEKYMEN